MCKIIVILIPRIGYILKTRLNWLSRCITFKIKLISEQKNDPELAPLFNLVLPPVEPDKLPVWYYVSNGVLMCKWRPSNVPASDEWLVVRRVVVPKVYQSEILKLAHESSVDGHLGINKTAR